MVRNAKDRKARQRESLLRSVEGFSNPVPAPEPSTQEPPTPEPPTPEPPAQEPKDGDGATKARTVDVARKPAPVKTSATKPTRAGKGAAIHATAGERRAAEHVDRRNFKLPSGTVYRSFTSRLTLENMKALKRVAVEMDTSIQSIVNALIEEGLNQGRCDLHTANRFLER